MIWKRTPAGEAELKTHAAGLRAAAQNVLMILDGVKTEQMLLTNLAGVTREDFRALIQLGLIEPVEPDLTTGTSRGAGAQATSPERRQKRAGTRDSLRCCQVSSTLILAWEASDFSAPVRMLRRRLSCMNLPGWRSH